MGGHAELVGEVHGASPIPGAFELLESGGLDEERPGFAQLERAGMLRRPREDPSEERSRWRAFVDRIRGYRRGVTLIDDHVLWLQLIELVPPFGVKAKCSRKSSSQQNAAMSIEILGTGLGGGSRASVSAKLEFETDGAPIAVEAPVTLGATEYVHDRFPTIIRVDAALVEDHVRLRPAVFERPPPFDFELVERVDLTDMDGSGTATWLGSAAREAAWSWNLGAEVPVLGKTKISVGLKRVDETEVSFELPYGADYLIYSPLDRSPVLPRCAIAPRADA